MTNLELNAFELLALKFRKENGLGDTAPIDFHRLLESLKIITIFRPLSDNFSGMCLVSPEKKNGFILINSNQSRGRQRFTIAHELYHIFFDEKFTPHYCSPGTSGKNPSEKAADSFASALLMPSIGLTEIIIQSNWKKRIDIPTLIKLGQYYSVSHTSLLVRLKELSYINNVQKDEFWNYRISEEAIRYGYDDSLYSRPANEGLIIGNYVGLATELFDKEIISEGHYTELLNKLNFENG